MGLSYLRSDPSKPSQLIKQWAWNFLDTSTFKVQQSMSVQAKQKGIIAEWDRWAISDYWSSSVLIRMEGYVNSRINVHPTGRSKWMGPSMWHEFESPIPHTHASLKISLSLFLQPNLAPLSSHICFFFFFTISPYFNQCTSKASLPTLHDTTHKQLTRVRACINGDGSWTDFCHLTCPGIVEYTKIMSSIGSMRLIMLIVPSSVWLLSWSWRSSCSPVSLDVPWHAFQKMGEN